MAYLVWLVVGALVGGAAASFIAPSMLETLLATTGAADAMCQCSELVRRTATRLIQLQITGAAIGAVVFPIGAFLARRKFKKPGAAAGSTAGTT